MSFIQKLRGTIETFFQIGKDGPQIEGDAAVPAFNARNAGNSAYVNVRGKDPVIDDDLVTKRYADGLGGGGQSLVFVYSPSNPGPLPANWFSSFAALDAAIALVPEGEPIAIVADATYTGGGAVTVPAGTYTWQEDRCVTWYGHNALPGLGFADGVSFPCNVGRSKVVFDETLGSVVCANAGATGPYVFSFGGTLGVVEIRCNVPESFTAGPFVTATKGAVVRIEIRAGATVSTSNGKNLFESRADGFGPATIAIGLYDGAQLQQDTISFGDGGLLELDDGTGHYSPIQTNASASGFFYPTSGGGAYQTIVELVNQDATASLESCAYNFRGFHSGGGTGNRTLTLPATPNPGQRVRVFVSDNSIDLDGQNRKVTIDGNGHDIVSTQNDAFAPLLDGTGYYPTTDGQKFTLGGPWVGSHGCVDLLFDDTLSKWIVVGLYAPYALLPSCAATLVDQSFPIVDGTPSAQIGFAGLSVDRTITLPANPFCGLTFTFTDQDGSLTALTGRKMTLDGNSFNIRGPGTFAGTYDMTQATVGEGGSVTLQFQSDDVWHVIAKPG